MEIRARLNNQSIILKITQEKERLIIRSKYHPKLIEELKALEDARWHPEEKIWSCAPSERNLYSLSTLEKNDPRYSLNFSGNFTEDKQRPLMKHQLGMVSQGINRQRVIIAGEMGTGKTLAALETMMIQNDHSGGKNHYWIVCPKSAKYSWEREIIKWHFPLKEYFPLGGKKEGTYKFISYNQLEKELTSCPEELFPDGVIFDEAHLLKNPTANRTKAAIILGSLLRARKKDPLIILLTGTPAPKDPTDWWTLTEICQAGYLRESSKTKLGYRLGVWETNVGNAGQEYKSLVYWKEEELKTLYKRLKGMVHVYLKKDCLDLPEKIYEPIFLPIDESTLKQLKMFTSFGGKGIATLALLRQRSDGFQYHSICPTCHGEGKISSTLIEGKIECPGCKGEGEKVLEVPTPKDQKLIEDLDELEEQEINRVVIYAAYHKSIDKIFSILLDEGWGIVRLDGRGLLVSPGINQESWQDDWENKDKKIAFLGHPKAGGLGLNLQKAEHLIFYSNDFDGAARPQAEDRIHRIGTTRAIIRDYLWLPTDYYVLENLKKKRELQGITTGEIEKLISEFSQKKYWEF